MDATEIMTPENWKAAAVAGIEQLPEDLQTSIGYADDGHSALTIRIAVPPTPHSKNREAKICKVRVFYWRTEQERWEKRERFDALLEVSEPYPPGDERWGWSTVAVSGESSAYDFRFFLGAAQVGWLSKMVQFFILEEMVSGGGVGPVRWNCFQGFVREDGTPVLECRQ